MTTDDQKSSPELSAQVSQKFKSHMKEKPLQAPQRRPSASMLRTHFSRATISVSSSQGLTSRRRLLLAIRAGSVMKKKPINMEKTDKLKFSVYCLIKLIRAVSVKINYERLNAFFFLMG